MVKEIKSTRQALDYCRNLKSYLKFHQVPLEVAGSWIAASKRTMVRKMKQPDKLTIKESLAIFEKLQIIEDSRRRIEQS